MLKAQKEQREREALREGLFNDSSFDITSSDCAEFFAICVSFWMTAQKRGRGVGEEGAGETRTFLIYLTADNSIPNIRTC